MSKSTLVVTVVIIVIVGERRATAAAVVFEQQADDRDRGRSLGESHNLLFLLPLVVMVEVVVVIPLH